MSDQQTDTPPQDQPEQPTQPTQPTQPRPQQSTRPKEQTSDDQLKQAKSEALTPDEKHSKYLEDIERLHGESVVDSLGHTPRAG